jgi:hypothetical protein
MKTWGVDVKIYILTQLEVSGELHTLATTPGERAPKTKCIGSIKNRQTHTQLNNKIK